MTSLTALNNYGSASSSDDSDEEPKTPKATTTPLHLATKFSGSSTVLDLPIVAAPVVTLNAALDTRRHLDPLATEVKYNPKYEELYAPVAGPENPFKTQQQAANKNTLAGYVEDAHVNAFQFETQRRTFHSYGYAYDPSTTGEGEGDKLVGSEMAAAETEFKTVFEDMKKRPLDKRKRDKNTDPADIEGYLGPWAKYKDEETVSRPNDEDAAYLEEYLAKKQKKGKTEEEVPLEEKSVLHIKDAEDYQGRSFTHIPQDLGVNLKSTEPPHKCFIPKRQIHSWSGHKKGVSVIRWFPTSAHLIMSGSMDSTVKLWEVYKGRRCVRTYSGHKQAIRDVNFNNSGERFLTASYDRYIKMWDTETGDVIGRFSNKKMAFCAKFNPCEDKQHLIVAGTSSNKIICWDVRSGDIVQEYDRHLAAVNTITFVDRNRRFVTTSDDKSMRVWEWNIPVDMKYIADPSMHSMPAVSAAPNGKWIACQSLDNKISVYQVGDRFKEMRKKVFKGHMVAGYACGLDFSPEMSYLASGDGDGKVYIWDWKTTKLLSKWKAHDDVCIQVLWHPHEASKVASAGWDGVIKFWD
eukprot:GFUD01018537.1.p1 GENE.GFUD01018537.1~~GFUD01018537.1.p1  ORF type:complete len:577 (-),score=167.48 GFUD01018537.1:105-1835(-)